MALGTREADPGGDPQGGCRGANSALWRWIKRTRLVNVDDHVEALLLAATRGRRARATAGARQRQEHQRAKQSASNRRNLQTDGSD